MVMIKNSIKSVVVPLALSSFVVIQGCKKDEEVSKTDLLVGDWEVTEVNGDDYTNLDYSLLFKFTSSGDFQFCSEYENKPADNYCYAAKWKWEDSNEKKIIMDQFTDTSGDISADFEVDILTETNFEGTWSVSYDSDLYSQKMKFVKVK